MEKQTVNIETRSNLILQLAKDNANEDCWRIIELLPNENPSPDEMINACTKVRSNSHNMSLLADSVAAAVKLTPRCYRCGQQDHLKVNCPRKPGDRDISKTEEYRH